MCGIAGIFSSFFSHEDAEVATAQMLKAMRHRGPDSSGIFSCGPCTLGHNRLAVIDTTNAASQPMTESGVTLIFNGELYNFLEERRRLEEGGDVFKSASDTEVLLKLYLRYGRDCLARLRGMYAFALWDKREKTFFCARDPLGIKPFLFSAVQGGIIFASELKGLLASGLVSRELSRNALRCLLERGSVSQPASILADVLWLLPGQCMSLREGASPIFSQFSTLKAGKINLTGMHWEEVLALGRRYVETALERQLIADVPLGAFLSGGVDSSLLVALMAQRHSNVSTFSVGFESGLETASDDETDDAVEVARHLGVRHTKVVVRQSEVAEDLRAVAKGLDHPTVDGVNSWFIAKAVRNELTVAVSGTGGDELFAGYPWFGAMREWENAAWWRKLPRSLRGETFLDVFDQQYRIFSAQEAELLCHGTRKPNQRSDPLETEEALTRVTGLVLQGYTRDQLLADIDNATMWHSLEVRVPLLDEDLLDFALSLPPHMKVGTGSDVAPEGSYAATGVKRLLLAMAEPALPAGFMLRAKRGFTLPFDGWLRGGLFPQMDYLLSETVVRKRGFFEPGAVTRVKRSFMEGRCTWVQPWLLLMAELWAQEVLDA
ncbi:Asparagine synthetase [uncultured delta proteobacterium]|uniref:asparagine synthase (glutamine-hydrolyzing) n=1 Tax=uncultured delta proteobacterium TaxID=34034 RepID=A0A212KGP1_9DELT|nr:Asparagine synthetase [uncultured delta proteobacterium]